MVESIGNIIVMVVFGLLIGSFLQLSNVFSVKQQLRRLGEAESVESYRKDVIQIVINKYQKAYRILAYINYVIFGIMILMIIFSPLKVNWGALVISIFVGWGVMYLIFNRAKAGKISM